MKDYLETGRITGTHGIRGDIKIDFWCDSYEDFHALPALYLAVGTEYIRYPIVKNSPYKGQALCHLEGIDIIEVAEPLRGCTVYAARADLCLPDDRVFIADILGLPVIDAADGVCYGTLADVNEIGARQLYEIKRQDGSLSYLPAIKEFIDRIEDGNAIFVRPPEGLF